MPLWRDADADDAMATRHYAIISLLLRHYYVAISFRCHAAMPHFLPCRLLIIVAAVEAAVQQVIDCFIYFHFIISLLPLFADARYHYDCHYHCCRLFTFVEAEAEAWRSSSAAERGAAMPRHLPPLCHYDVTPCCHLLRCHAYWCRHDIDAIMPLMMPLYYARLRHYAIIDAMLRWWCYYYDDAAELTLMMPLRHYDAAITPL